MSESKDIASVEEVVRELRTMAEYLFSDAYSEDYEQHKPALDRAIAMLQSFAKDASRYRWFCDQPYPDDIADDATKWPNFKAALDERIDTAIDLARGQSL